MTDRVITQSAALKALLSGESVAASRLNRSLFNELLNEELLLMKFNGTRRRVMARSPEALQQYLINKDERYALYLCPDTTTRGAMAAATGNSKLTGVRSCPGFPVNSYEPIPCRLNGQAFEVHPPEGSFLFVADWEQFYVPSDVTLIGIENMESFRLVRQQQAFFRRYLQQHHLPLRALFVSRYPQSADLHKWLQTRPNHYVHFGDFDLAAIHIYMTEFQCHLPSGQSSFLIPDDIVLRLSQGSRQRYNDQYERFKHLKADSPELQQLIALIHRERKCYDQEGYHVCPDSLVDNSCKVTEKMPEQQARTFQQSNGISESD